MEVVLEVLAHRRNTKHIVYVVEGLLEHCFSDDREHYHSQDIHWFLELVNQQFWDEIYPIDSPVRKHFHDLQKSKSSKEHLKNGCIPLNMFKFYLSRILCKSKDVSVRPTVVVPWKNEVSYKHCLHVYQSFIFNISSICPGSFRDWECFGCSKLVL